MPALPGRASRHGTIYYRRKLSVDGGAGISQQLKALRQGELAVDGYKGQRLTFRAWDGQLRQPLLLTQASSVVEVAPVEGFLHPRSALDTLGFDQPESGCRTP